MKHALPLALLLAASATHAGYACRDLSDPEGRRWFQDEPCGPGYRHDPLPDPPFIREAPRIPDSWGVGSSGSQLQIVGFDERGRRVGYWVERGTARPFVSTDVVRVNGGRGRGRR